MGHTKRKHNPQLKARTTRSSKGRLLSLSDPAQTSQQLDDQLRQLGLYPASTLGDGNCLFRALSDQLYGTDSKHAQLRQDICDWIQKHKARYEPFVEDERGIDTHLRCMRENATYGGHMELSAFAHMARRNVKVVQPGLVYVIEWQAFASSSSPISESPSPPLPDKEVYHQEADTDNSTIYVAYHDWEHFSSIRNLKGPHVGLPRVKEQPAPIPDATSSPFAEEYKPAKDRKKAVKDRERERRERKREKAREKNKFSTHPNEGGKQREETEEIETEPDEDQEPELDPEVEPEKLKIKLKLTLSRNTSSANLSESEYGNGHSSTPQRTGLKLRLPPSRSLSVTPSSVSTPPTSRASTTSTTSASSTSTLPTAPASTSTQPPPPPSTSSATIYDQALPHAHPPTHTSAPHLVSDTHPTDDYGPQRTNRSPKRTFDESELEDSHSTTGRARSRLCGPDREPVSSTDHKASTTTTTATGTVRRKPAVEQPEDANGRDSTTEREVEEREVARTLVAEPSLTGGGEEIDNEGGYESGFTSSSLSSSPDQALHSKEEGDEPGTPRTSLSNSPSSSTSRQRIRRNDPLITPTAPVPNDEGDDTIKIRKKSQPSSSPSKPVTRRQKQEAALGAAAVGGDRPLTRRQRKLLGLPKLKKMAGPYDRRVGGPTTRGGGKDDDESEWKKNGTGRVDVRGFRELKI